jgi:hypothetical protein
MNRQLAEFLDWKPLKKLKRDSCLEIRLKLFEPGTPLIILILLVTESPVMYALTNV